MDDDLPPGPIKPPPEIAKALGDYLGTIDNDALEERVWARVREEAHPEVIDFDGDLGPLLESVIRIGIVTTISILYEGAQLAVVAR